MDLKLIKSLLNLISNSEVNEVTIEEGDFKIQIKKQADQITSNQTPVYIPAPAPVPAAAQQAAAPEASGSNNQEAEAGNSKNIIIRSPIVGTFYRSSSPDSGPFIKEGDTIARGDTLCIVEAMKIMNEIESEHAGKIIKILVDDSQPVEFDQPLFEIEPS
ncbi:MAG TPA: acetyl-CoA carboxylase biotin carboxyl carrier protein [Balneolales bacterium]|nr:acetyl-CoA carboxylase biotin carboxyl carrier protein [Balneolales bacterium]